VKLVEVFHTLDRSVSQIPGSEVHHAPTHGDGCFC
jgi:hypothetical protein